MNKIEKKKLFRELIIAGLTGVSAILFLSVFHLVWYLAVTLTIVIYIGLQFIYKQSNEEENADSVLSEGHIRIKNIKQSLSEMKFNNSKSVETKNVSLDICNDIVDILNYVEKNPDKYYQIQSFVKNILTNIEQMIQRYVELSNKFNDDSLSKEIDEIYDILTKMKSYMRNVKEKVLREEFEDLQLSKSFLKEIMELEDTLK